MVGHLERTSGIRVLREKTAIHRNLYLTAHLHTFHQTGMLSKTFFQLSEENKDLKKRVLRQFIWKKVYNIPAKSLDLGFIKCTF